jgi:hypothetical protein
MLEAELLERDRWSRDHLLVHQEERVRALITHAVSRSPYYREALGADAAERPLAELPTLSKATLMASRPGATIRGSPGRSASPPRPDPSQSFLGEYRVATIRHDRPAVNRGVHAEEAAAWRAVSGRPMMRMEIGFRPRFAALGSPSPVHVTRQVLVPPGVPMPPVSAGTPIAELVAALNAQQPELLLGALGVWRALAEEQIAGRLRIAPKAAVFGSDSRLRQPVRSLRLAVGRLQISSKPRLRRQQAVPNMPSWKLPTTSLSLRSLTRMANPWRPAGPAPRCC